MSDHLVLFVDRLVTTATLEQPVLGAAVPGPYGEGSCACTATPSSSTCGSRRVDEHMVPEEEEPLIQMVECRICQEEDHMENLETPCACSGSLKFAHRNCVQKWCNEKGDTTCEICNQAYQPGYTSPPPQPHYEDTAIDISDGWTISGTTLDLHDPMLLEMAVAEHDYLEAENGECDTRDDSGVSFCRCAALILLIVLFLRNTMLITNSDGEEDASVFFSSFLLRAAGFLLPCYIMAWAISFLQRRRQIEEGAAEVAFIIQSGQQRRLQFTIVPGSAVTNHQDPLQ